MNEDILTAREQDSEEHWISISDMMAGLMVIFLFIAISYMLFISKKMEEIEKEKEKIEKIVEAYVTLRSDLYAALREEFEIKNSKKWEEWKAHLDETTLSIRFKKPFKRGIAEVPQSFKNILDDFFPRYIGILTDAKYVNDISEIRIEGHTSSEWDGVEDREELAYVYNMKLSQDRTRSVLNYVLRIKNPRIKQNRKWIRENLTANGLSSSKLIRKRDGTQNREESRRVEFRVRTNAEKRIIAILKESEK